MGGCESSESRRNKNSSSDQENEDKGDQASELQMSRRRTDQAIEIGVAVAALVGVGLLAWGVGSFLSSPSRRKMMKAPGRDSFIFRDDFEDDPASYFRALRKN